MNKSTLDATVFQNDWHTMVDVSNNSEKPRCGNGYENTMMRKILDEKSDAIIAGLDTSASQTVCTENIPSSNSIASTTDRFKLFENNIKKTSSKTDLQNNINEPPIPGPKPDHYKEKLDNFGRPIPGPKPSLNRFLRQRGGYNNSLLGLLNARCVFETRNFDRPIIVDECRKSRPKCNELNSVPKVVDVVYKMKENSEKKPSNKYTKFDNLFQLPKTSDSDNKEQTLRNVREKIDFFNKLTCFKSVIRQPKCLDLQLNKSVEEIKMELRNIATSKSTDELHTRHNAKSKSIDELRNKSNYKSIESFGDITLDSAVLNSSELDRKFNQLYIDSKSTNTIDKLGTEFNIPLIKSVSNPDILISQISEMNLSSIEDPVNIATTKSRLKEILLSTLFDQFQTMILAGSYLKNLQTPLKYISHFTKRALKANESEHLLQFIHNLCTACDYGVYTWSEYSNDINAYQDIPVAISDMLSTLPLDNNDQDGDETLLSEDDLLELLFEHFETVVAIRDFLKTLTNLFKTIWLAIEDRFNEFINPKNCEDFIARLSNAAEAGYNNCDEYCDDIIYLSTIHTNEKNSAESTLVTDDLQKRFQNSLKNLERPDWFRKYGNLQNLNKAEEDETNRTIDRSLLPEENLSLINDNVVNSSSTSSNKSIKDTSTAGDNINGSATSTISNSENSINRTFIIPSYKIGVQRMKSPELETRTPESLTNPTYIKPSCIVGPQMKESPESETRIADALLSQTTPKPSTSSNATPKRKNCVRRISSAIFEYIQKKKSKSRNAEINNKDQV